jgi:hypothetical protein
MQAIKLALNGGSQGQVGEQIGEHVPHILIAVLLHALLIEAVDLVNLSGSGGGYLLSWLPRSRVMRSLYRIFRTSTYDRVYTPLKPRST